MAHLIRIQPQDNIRRFYALQVAPTLFGDWALWREWGRTGQPGTVKMQTFACEAEATAAKARSIKRKLRRGYVYAARETGPTS